jgi:hypothetical protein
MPDTSSVELHAALKAASVQAASLAMLNAVQHLQRTSVLVEAATALSLAQALRPPGSGQAEPCLDGVAGLDAARAAMEAAMKTFQDTLAAASDLAGAR